MSLKIRIVIFKPEHKNDIFILRKKKLEGKKFTRDNCAYFLNDDHFQITTDAPWYRLWMFKRYFATYYYAQGQAQPLPVPLFKGMRVEEETGKWTVEDGAKGLTSQLSSEEVAAAFNPWFYRTIAAPVRDLWEQLQFYIGVGTLLGVVYIIWRLHEDAGGAAAEAVGTVPPPGSSTTVTGA